MENKSTKYTLYASIHERLTSSLTSNSKLVATSFQTTGPMVLPMSLPLVEHFFARHFNYSPPTETSNVGESLFSNMYVIQTMHSDSLQTGPCLSVSGRAFLFPREDLEQVGERLAGVWH